MDAEKFKTLFPDKTAVLDKHCEPEEDLDRLLPLADVEAFARDLEAACERVILDHYLVGDGSVNGLRTQRSRLPRLLADAGFTAWTRLDALWEVAAVFRRVFSDGARVSISRSGFNGAGTRTATAAAPMLF